MENSKSIALFLDGTWNDVQDNTNIWRLSTLCSPVARDGTLQTTYYDQGVGTRWGERIVGGALGYGLERSVIAAYQWLIKTYNPGDRVFVFGFSRGAYTARSLTGLIAKCGLLQPGAPLSVRQVFERYRQSRSLRTLYDLEYADGLLARRQRGETTKDQRPIPEFTRQERWLLTYSRRIDIRFVGVFDTVGALGIPFGHVPGLSRSSFEFHHTRLSNLFDFAFQALAIDEHRKAFSPALWTRFTPTVPQDPPKKVPVVEQRWFCGAHANVGGGYADDRLAQLPLHWLVEKAIAAGLDFRFPVQLDATYHRDPVADSYSEMMGGFYKVATLGKRHYRTIGAPSFNVPQPSGTVSTVNETIDASVFERWRDDNEYRPPAVSRWAERLGLNPDSLHGATAASNGSVLAP